MKRFLEKHLFLLLLLHSQVSLATDQKQLVRLPMEQLYTMLDEAMADSTRARQAKAAHIADLKHHYSTAKTLPQRYQAARKLFDGYQKFSNDSTLKYGQAALNIANAIGEDSLIAESTMRLANQYTSAGHYEEARKYMEKVDPTHLSRPLKTLYYLYYTTLYGELASYGSDSELVAAYWKKTDAFRDSVVATAERNTPLWYDQSVYNCFKQRNFNQALDYCSQWEAMLQTDTPEYAKMAFVTSEVYNELGNTDMRKRWLAISALSDLRCAIMNQASLWTLAGLLSKEGDLKRAYRYIDYSWKCASTYNAHLRSWQISPIVTTINDQYKSQLHKTNRLLWTLMAVASVLSVVLLVMYFYVARKRRQLATAQHQLRKANDSLASLNSQLKDKNDELSESNSLLQQTNDQLKQVMMKLNDSNRVKDEYIGKFLNLCSDYIDKLENYRIKVNRKLKAGQQADLLKMTNSEQLKENELKELFDNFDSVFLHLFPTFVSDFNALLRPGEDITPPADNRLNTDLRIFALIRLGIDESSKIADFLRYSPNSIYSYRARIKNKAAGNRDEFERMVKEIGIFAD